MPQFITRAVAIVHGLVTKEIVDGWYGVPLVLIPLMHLVTWGYFDRPELAMAGYAFCLGLLLGRMEARQASYKKKKEARDGTPELG